MANPYRRVHGLIRRRRGGRLLALAPIAAALVAAPLLRPVLFGYLGGPRVAAGAADSAVRVSLVVLAVMALHLYTDLVRGPDRPVLDPHPVQPRALLTALLVRSARRRLDVLAAALIVLGNLAVSGELVAYAAASLFAAGTWAACLGVPYAVYLGAVWAARSPSMAGVLNLMRGDNAPMHAALIYAPGLVALAVGLPMSWVMVAVEWAIEGWAPGWAWLLLLPALGVAGFAAALPLADRYYVPTTALLSEIDGLYAGVDTEEEGRLVYLQWLAGDRPELLRALRQAGRSRAAWNVGAWVLGGLAAIAAWSKGGAGLGWMALLSMGGVAAAALLPALLASGDPPWLDRALGVRPRAVAMARAATGVLYAQGAVVPPLAVGLLRHGTDVLEPIVAAEGLAVVGSVVAAQLARRLGARALWIAAPNHLVLWAAALAASVFAVA